MLRRRAVVAVHVDVLVLVHVLVLGCTYDTASSPTADAGFTTECGPEPDPPTAPCRADATGTVTRVVDGDTIRVAIDGGTEEDVRLVGVDAPEHDEGDCGTGATAWLRARLPLGTSVTLTFDDHCVDPYDRALAFVHDADGFVNAQILSQGQAQACSFRDENLHYEPWFGCIESEASAADAGLWAIGCHLDPCFQ